MFGGLLKKEAAADESTDVITNTDSLLEGWLIKTNSKGERKLRFCSFEGDRFRACKPDKKRPILTDEIKEDIDLKHILNVTFPVDLKAKKNVMSINLLDGHFYEFEGGHCDVWASRIRRRLKDSLDDVSKNVYSKDVVHMKGKLLKTSHNKYQKALQERFVKIQGRFLLYYKKEGDEKELGCLNLETSEFVRPYDRTPECCMFEVFDEGRIYGFQAHSNAEMLRWIAVIDSLRSAVLEHAEVAKMAESMAMIPYRVNLFDNQSIDDYLFHIENELNYIFPEEYEPDIEENDSDSESESECEGDGEVDKDENEVKNEVDNFDSESKGQDDQEIGEADVNARRSKGSEGDNNEGGDSSDDDSSDGGASSADDSEGDDQGSDEKEVNGDEAEPKNGDLDVDDLSNEKSAALKKKSIKKVKKEKPVIVKRTLMENLELAKAVIDFMHTLIDEDVKYDKSQGIRYDILSMVLLEVNLFLNLRLNHVFDVSNEELNSASLLEVHAVIDWICKYQTFNRRNKCVLPPDSLANDYLAGRQPNFCPLFDKIPVLCNRYVNGNGSGKNGAATLLVDHCCKVWDKFLETPAELLDRHKDGSFFTHTPVDMWEALNQHLNLAKQTKSPVLHVMIADKIAAALSHVTLLISEFVDELNFDNDIVLKDIALEFLCALANNNALHIEEIVSLVDNFKIDELRSKIDEIFDPVTVNLVLCGDRCLKKIAGVIMNDLEDQFSTIFSYDWLEGTHLKTICATCSDYINDLESYLMPFWSEKFVNILLEACVLKYVRSILFNKMRVLKPPEPPKKVIIEPPKPAPEPQNQTISSSLLGWGNKLKAAALAAVASVQDVVEESAKTTFADKIAEDAVYTRAESESIGKLGNDANLLNGFFSQKVGPLAASKLLDLINEVSFYLFVPYNQIASYALGRIAEFPTSANAIYEVVRHCMMLREDCTYEDYIDVLEQLTPAVEVAPASSKYNAENGIPEGFLGLLYADVVQGQLDDGVGKKSATEDSLAQRLKNMAGIPLLALKQALADEDDEDEIEGDKEGENDEHERKMQEAANRINSNKRASLLKRRHSAIVKQSDWLVDEVLDVLDQQENEELEILKQIEEEKRAVENKKKEVGVINFESHLEKKSGSMAGLWQSRWFKISTRENTGDNSHDVPYIYTFMWFTKKGGSIANSYTIDKLERFSICDSDRPLSVITTSNKLCLSSEAKEDLTVEVKEFGEKDAVSSTFSLKGQMYVFMVTIEGKDHYLRASKVDMMIKWVNLLALTTNFKYDSTLHYWTHSK